MLQILFPLGMARYFAGGLLIGMAVALLYLFTGRLGGMSTLFTSTWSYVLRLRFFQQARFVQSRNWRLLYALGLILGGAFWWSSVGKTAVVMGGLSVWKMVLGGFLVGFGARMANGCTSGHGICGLGSWQKPSLIAVLTFMVTAFATANLIAWLSNLSKVAK
jgi:uncharacterized membrane protein YedE/YeeE